MSKRSRRRTADLIANMHDKPIVPVIVYERLSGWPRRRYNVWNSFCPSHVIKMNGEQFDTLRVSVARTRAIIPEVRMEEKVE